MNDEQVAVYATTEGGTDSSQAIADSAARLGYETQNNRPPDDLPVHFCDFPFSKPEEQQDFGDHLEAVKREEPELAVAPDIEGGRDAGAVYEQADELAEYAETVVVVPKETHPSDVPDRFRVGIPLANFGSDAPWDLFDYLDCSSVHLLGGPPQAQRRVAATHINVDSVDGATMVKAADFKKLWQYPKVDTGTNRTHWVVYAHSDYYDRIRVSCDNTHAAINGAGEAREEPPYVEDPKYADYGLDNDFRERFYDDDRVAGPREHACQEPDCERPACPEAGQTYCERHAGQEINQFRHGEQVEDYEAWRQRQRRVANAVEADLTEIAADGGTNQPDMSDTDIDSEQYESDLTFSDDVGEITGIGDAGQDGLADLGVETVGEWWDAGAPFQFVAAGWRDDALEQVLGSPDVDQNDADDLMRVFLGATNGALYDENGDRLGGAASAVLGNLDYEAAMWSWFDNEWHRSEAPSNSDKNWVQKAARPADDYHPKGAFGTGDDVPRDALSFTPDPEADKRDRINDKGVDITALSGLHRVENAYEATVSGPGKVVYYEADLPVELAEQVENSDYQDLIRKDTAQIRRPAVEFISSLFGADYTDPEVARELVEVVVDTSSQTKPHGTDKGPRHLAVFHHPAGDAHAIIQENDVVTPTDLNLAGDTYDPVQEWAGEVAQQREEKEQALETERGSTEWLSRGFNEAPQALVDEGYEERRYEDPNNLRLEEDLDQNEDAAPIADNLAARMEQEEIAENEQAAADAGVYDPSDEFEDNDTDDKPVPKTFGGYRQEKVERLENTPHLDPIESFDSVDEMVEAIREIHVPDYSTPPEDTIDKLQHNFDRLPSDEAERYYLNDYKLTRTLNSARRHFNKWVGRKKRYDKMPGWAEAGPANYPKKKHKKRRDSARKGKETLDEKLDRLNGRTKGAFQRALKKAGTSEAELNAEKAQNERESMRSKLYPGAIVYWSEVVYDAKIWGVKRLNKKTVRLKSPDGDGDYYQTTVEYDNSRLKHLPRDEWSGVDADKIDGDVPAAFTEGYDAAIRYLMGEEWVADNLDPDNAGTDPHADADELDADDRQAIEEAARNDDLQGVLNAVGLSAKGPFWSKDWENAGIESVADLVDHYDDRDNFERVRGIGPSKSDDLEAAVPIIRNALDADDGESADTDEDTTELGIFERDESEIERLEEAGLTRPQAETVIKRERTAENAQNAPDWSLKQLDGIGDKSVENINSMDLGNEPDDTDERVDDESETEWSVGDEVVSDMGEEGEVVEVEDGDVWVDYDSPASPIWEADTDRLEPAGTTAVEQTVEEQGTWDKTDVADLTGLTSQLAYRVAEETDSPGEFVQLHREGHDWEQYDGIGEVYAERIEDAAEDLADADHGTETDNGETETHDVDAETVVFVGCGNAKKDGTHPAKDLYTSTYFEKKRKFAEGVGDEWYILSAEHGVVHPDEQIETYDTGIDEVDADTWMANLRTELPDLDGATAVVLAGSDYLEPARQALESKGATVEAPTAGMGIGDRMAWLKDNVPMTDESAETDESAAQSDTPDGLTDITGIGETTADALQERGISTPHELGEAFETQAWDDTVRPALPGLHADTITQAAGRLAAADGPVPDPGKAAERVNDARDLDSQATDDAIQAERQTTSFTEWIQAPNQMDFAGVDSIRNVLEDATGAFTLDATADNPEVTVPDGGTGVYQPTEEDL